MQLTRSICAVWTSHLPATKHEYLACMQEQKHVPVYMRTRTYMHAHTHICMRAHISLSLYIYIYIYIYMCIHIYIYMSIYLSLSIRTGVAICLLCCIVIYTNIIYTYTHTKLYIYIYMIIMILYIYIYIYNIIHNVYTLHYKGYSIHGRTMQGRRTIQDQYSFVCSNTIVRRTIQDRTPPLTRRSPVCANLYCRCVRPFVAD